MICNPCDNYQCAGCISDRMFRGDLLDDRTAKKFCSCYANDHDRSKTTTLPPFSKEFEEAKKLAEEKEKEQQEKITEWQRDKDISEDDESD